MLSALLLSGLITLPITADAEVEFAEAKQAGFFATRERLKLKGIEHLVLLGFDAKPLAGKVVTKATLRIRAAGKDPMLRKIGLSTVAAPWSEVASIEDFLASTFSRAGTIWTQVYVTEGEDGWYEIPLDGRLLEACAAGLSHGIALSDDSGQTRDVLPKYDPRSNQGNNFLFARESDSPPLILVETAEGEAAAVTATATAVPASVKRSATASPGVAPLPSIPAPVEVAPAPKNEAATIFAIPDGWKADPVSGKVLEAPDAPRAGAVKVEALRGEWVAWQVVVEGTGTFQVRAEGLPVRFSRAWYVRPKGSEAWFADPLLPLKGGEALSIPDPANAVPLQRTQTIYAEVFVPEDAPAGRLAGKIVVTTPAGDLALPVEIDVGAAAIPREAAFVFSMNAYASPGAHYGKVDSQAFLEAERSFFVLAHEHRTTLAVLPYGQNGLGAGSSQPPIAGRGAEAKIADWRSWDARFGPLLDGSAFEDTPRAGVPIDHLYLPLSEEYPTPMADGYKWNGAQWFEHWRVAGPIEEGFSKDYQDAWAAVVRDFRRHARERGWERTELQVYLNDKYYWKRDGRGASFWLLDEPVFPDDFRALRFFGDLTRRGQEGDRRRVVYRVDVSRHEWGRDTLDPVVDLNVAQGFLKRVELLHDLRDRHGQRLWAYGQPPKDLDASATELSSQALELYTSGADGFVPWLTLGEPGHWRTFKHTTVIYTGKPMGIPGAVASLRLKAFRRAEQDVALLRLVAAKRGLPRDRLAALLPPKPSPVDLEALRAALRVALAR